MATPEFLKKMKAALDNGNVDNELSNKISEIYEIDKLADKKLAENDFKITDKIKELAKEGYFKDKISSEEVEKANSNADKFLKDINNSDIELKKELDEEITSSVFQELTDFENNLSELLYKMDNYFKNNKDRVFDDNDKLLIEVAKEKFYKLFNLFNE